MINAVAASQVDDLHLNLCACCIVSICCFDLEFDLLFCMLVLPTSLKSQSCFHIEPKLITRATITKWEKMQHTVIKISSPRGLGN